MGSAASTLASSPPPTGSSRRTLAFEVLGAGYPYRLRFSTPPSELAVVGQPLRDPPTVVAHDVNDNPATDAVASPVSLTLAPAGAVASAADAADADGDGAALVALAAADGSTPIATAELNGSVAFDDLAIPEVGYYVLVATSDGVRPASSATITVLPVPAAALPCAPPECQWASDARAGRGTTPPDGGDPWAAPNPALPHASAGADGDPARAVGAADAEACGLEGDGDGVGASRFGAALAAPPLRGGGARDGRRIVRERAVRRRA